MPLLKLRVFLVVCALVSTGRAAHAQSRDSISRDSLSRDSVSRVAARAAITALATVKVTGRADNLTGVAQSASQGRVGRADLRLRPLVREGEILENIPGMILTQHSGDGKANQMFVRGFNLDHGTDFETRIESMPINMPTHAHGQGYSDLNLLIPELVDRLDYKLGTYYAELGDFGAAGGATLHLARSLAAPIARVEAGAWGFGRTVLAGSHTRGRSTVLFGGEVKQYDGPWEVAQGLRKLSGLARWTWRGTRDELSVLGLSYANAWNASDQIPSRLVGSGAISRFGQVDPSLGGNTERHSLSVQWRRLLANGLLRVDAYGVRYGFNLWSNFTYQLDDAERGDQIEQVDHRTVGGLDAEYLRAAAWFGSAHTVRIGVQSRVDDARVALNKSTARVATSRVRADDVRQSSGAIWTSVESRWASRFRSIVGLRSDAYAFNVVSDLAANSGTRTAALASPKGSLVFGPFKGAEFYVGGGLGFHSNDARGSTISVDPVSGEPVSRVDPLVRSRGAEVGARVASTSGFRSTASLWSLSLDSELLFVGDAGTTEPQGRSRRTGVTVANFWRPDPRLTIDADVSFTRARYLDETRSTAYVPGALENVVAAGVTWEPPAGGFFSALRVRHFGAAPLIEDNRVRGTPTTLVNTSVGYVIRRVRLAANVLNLLGANARDIQYFYPSRLAGEPVGGVEDVHFHPVEPRQLRLSMSIGM